MELILTDVGVEVIHQNGNWLFKKDLGFSPVENLVNSVAACCVYVYENILKNSKVDFEVQKVLVEYTRSEKKPTKPINEITVTFYMLVPHEQQGKAERAAKLISKNCPVIQTLDKDVVINEVIKFV